MNPDFQDSINEDQAQRIASLIAGYLRRTLTEKEHDELDEWLVTNNENQQLFEELINPEHLEEGLQKFEAFDTKAALQKIKAKMQFSPAKQSILRQRRINYSIAASIVLLAGLFILYILMNRKTETGRSISVTGQIQPGGNYAILTLANGKTINLRDAKNGLIDSADGSEVLKTADGQLSYENNAVGANSYHLLTTPIGGQFIVLLPDGSRVWLNSSSSLRYPVSFTGDERVVELTGEGYFEVAKDAGKKFKVKLKTGALVEVFGTHFNVMAYDDEQYITTTLLEGAITLHSSIMTNAMSPGWQSTVSADGSIEIKRDVDTSSVVAWKNGLFKYKDAEIETIMRQVSRWYGAEVVYQGKVNEHFNATIYRSEPVSKLLDLLEQTREVHFTIEGKKIIVEP